MRYAQGGGLTPKQQQRREQVRLEAADYFEQGQRTSVVASTLRVSAWATKTRLEQARIIAAANESAGRTVVRALRILAPSSAPVPEPADVDPAPAAAPAGPVRTRETTSDGYRRALAAHREAAPPHRVDPAIAQAVERQNAAMRELSHCAFPEPDVAPDDAPAPIEAAREERPRKTAATEGAALHRARA